MIYRPLLLLLALFTATDMQSKTRPADTPPQARSVPKHDHHHTRRHHAHTRPEQQKNMNKRTKQYIVRAAATTAFSSKQGRKKLARLPSWVQKNLHYHPQQAKDRQYA